MPEWHGANGTGLKTCRKAWREGHPPCEKRVEHTYSFKQARRKPCKLASISKTGFSEG